MNKKKIGGEYVVKSVYVPHDRVAMWEKLQKKAKSESRSTSETVLEAVRQFLEGDKTLEDSD